MSKLIINERPLLIIPSLSLEIGLMEAVVLQQIHYWLTTSKHVMEGRKWVYNTYKDWQRQIPIWSEKSIKRTILSLEAMGLLIPGNWNRFKADRTKWYTIDYDRLAAIRAKLDELTSVQTAPNSVSELPEDGACLSPAIP